MLSVFKFGRSIAGRLKPSSLVAQRNSFQLEEISMKMSRLSSQSSHEEMQTTSLTQNVGHHMSPFSKLRNVEALHVERQPSNYQPLERFIEESPYEKKSEEENGGQKGGRKFGIFLTGASLGGIASTFWTYGQLKQQTKELIDLDATLDLGRETRKSVMGLGKVLHAAEVFNPDQAERPRSPVNNSLNQKPITGSRRDRFNFIAEVVEETAPALVYIQIKNLSVRDFYTGEAMTTSNGSGFLVREDGLILTNAHVVLNKPRSSLQVTLQDGRTFAGIVEDADVGSDLATVRIQAKGLPVMKLGKSSTIRPGEFVIAMGSPLSLTNTITTGVVSSPARNKEELHLKNKNVSEYIQTDAAITFGNSGGPLLNLDGEAIGINSMKLTPGISFAIPIDHAKEFLQKSQENSHLRQARKRPRRYMGVTMVALDDHVKEELRLRHQLPPEVTHGILVFRMVQDSPADRAGIRPGDIITHINGKSIHKTGDVYQILEQEQSLQVTIVRQGKAFRLEVHLES